MPAAVNQAVLVISDLCWARGNATGGPYRAGKSSRSRVKLMSVLDLGETQFTRGAASGPGRPVGIHENEALSDQLQSRGLPASVLWMVAPRRDLYAEMPTSPFS